MLGFIDELECGTKVCLQANDNEGKSVSLDTEIAGELSDRDLCIMSEIRKQYQKLHYIITDPVREEGLLINFESEKVINSVVVLREGRPYIWRGVNIVNLRLPDYGSVHIVTSNEKMRECNRRRTYRLFLGMDASFKPEGARKPKEVCLKDISEGGVGILAKSIKGIEEGMTGEVSFSDEETGAFFKIPVTIVRIQDMGNDRVIYGCMSMVKSSNLSRFINYKQQQRMRGHMISSKPVEAEVEENTETNTEVETAGAGDVNIEEKATESIVDQAV